MSKRSSDRRFYLVHALDAPGKQELRQQLGPTHREYMMRHQQQLLVGGPLLSEEGTQRIGSAFIIQAESREQVEALMRQEPYNAGGVFESVIIRLFESVMFEPTLLKEE